MRMQIQLFFGKQEKITGERITPPLNPILDKTISGNSWKISWNPY
jgi:hypothetical protein